MDISLPHIQIQYLYYRSWWRSLLGKVFPILPVKRVRVNETLKFCVDDQNLMTAQIPAHGVSFMLDLRSGTISSTSTPESKAIGYDVRVSETRSKRNGHAVS